MSVQSNKVEVLYFTDPVCAASWGIEPSIRRLQVEYGHVIDLEIHMGGLLPTWETFSVPGISEPADLAKMWEKAGKFYGMPLTGKVWLDDPLESSFPACVAFKAAQLQGAAQAEKFLRLLRESVLLEAKNIAKQDVLLEVAVMADLDVEKFKADYNGKAKELFDEDLQLARQLGVAGFPTVIFRANGKSISVVGVRDYAMFESVLKEVAPEVKAAELYKDVEEIFHRFASLSIREVDELSSLTAMASAGQLSSMTGKKILFKKEYPNGFLWRKVGNVVKG